MVAVEEEAAAASSSEGFHHLTSCFQTDLSVTVFLSSEVWFPPAVIEVG